MNRGILIRLLLGLGVVAIAFLIYRFLFVAKPGSPSGSLPGLEKAPAEVGVSDEFLNLLLSLQQIKLSGEVLTNPIFTSLVDFSTELKDQTPGRNNPFAPIGVGGRPLPDGNGTSTPER